MTQVEGHPITPHFTDADLRAVHSLSRIFTPICHSLREAVEGLPAEGLRGEESYIRGTEKKLYNHSGITLDSSRKDKLPSFELFEAYIHNDRMFPELANSYQQGIDIYVPIGEYGEHLARATANGARAMYSAANNHIRELCDKRN